MTDCNIEAKPAPADILAGVGMDEAA